MPGEVVVMAAVEGIIDEAVIRVIFKNIDGARLGTVYGKKGKQLILKKIKAYNNAAQIVPWIVLVDLDLDFECVPLFRNHYLPANLSANLCFRVAVHEVESWLLADHKGLARFLGISTAKIPRNPETIDDPKATIVNLAQRSRKRVRKYLVPKPGSGRSIGEAYPSAIIEFIENHWRPEVARQHSDSLDRTIKCLEKLVHTRTEVTIDK